MTTSEGGKNGPYTVALHIVMPNQVSGPNVTNWRLASSNLCGDFQFKYLTQKRHAGGVLNFALLVDLYRQLRTIRPDLVHLSGLQGAGLHAILAAKLAGCTRSVVAIHGSSRDAVGLSPWRRKAFEFAEWLTLRMSDAFYTVCQDAQSRRFLSRHADRNLGVVRNASPDIRFDVCSARNQKRHELHVDAFDFLIAIAGRMVYDKGLSYIVPAIQRTHIPHVKYLFIGDGPYLERLQIDLSKEIDAGQVLLLGQRSDVLELLSACDLFLFASLHENLPNVLLEAVAVGLPIIATDVGGVAEIVVDNYNGKLIPPMNAEAICEALHLLIKDQELRTRYSKASLALAQSEYSMTLHEEKMRSIYQHLLNADSGNG